MCARACVRVCKRERKEMRRTRSSRNVNYIARKCNYYNELLNKEITIFVSALSRKTRVSEIITIQPNCAIDI